MNSAYVSIGWVGKKRDGLTSQRRLAEAVGRALLRYVTTSGTPGLMTVYDTAPAPPRRLSTQPKAVLDKVRPERPHFSLT